MFRWLIRKLTVPKDEDESTLGDQELRGTIYATSVADVVGSFLTSNPQSSSYSVHALIDAGAAELMSADELELVCEKICEHGYRDPINPTLRAELNSEQLFSFLCWQAVSQVDKAAYQNENTIRHLIEQFRTETGS